MGNRVLGEAFRSLKDVDLSKQKIKNLVLAAPDIDKRTFEEQIAPEFCAKAQNVTLYASSKDNALALSEGIHNNQRAGDTKPSVTICHGIHTIDASETDTSILGHGYYGNETWVLQDIHYFFDGSPPDKRFGLKEMETEAGSYWKFKPGIKN